MSSARPNFYRRITASVPLLVTVLVHIVLIAIAGYFVVSEQITGKKKIMEASAASEPSLAQKQVEHRLQVARKGGGSASSSPVSASRIFSTAANALQLPAMPDLPQVGASSLSGMGFGSGIGAVGTGTGNATGLGNGNGLGNGFMSLSFLGVTNQRASKVAFVIDIGPELMDIRKGGFRAFEILRREISRLVSTLPPSAEFNIVFFSGEQVRLFATTLQPATVASKTVFFEWIKPINASLQSLGDSSIPSASPRWNYQPAEKLKLDATYNPPPWIHALHAALEQQPDTVFLITGSAGLGTKDIDFNEAEYARKKHERDQLVAELKQQGFDLAAVAAARARAFAKLRADLAEINRRLVAQNKDPFVVPDIRRVLDKDFQAALKRAGFSLTIDTSGWTDKAGRQIWLNPESDKPAVLPKNSRERAVYSDLVNHVSKLQYGLLRERAALNIFLFTGPDEQTDLVQKNLSALSARNGGKFSLLTTKQLEQIGPE